MGIVVPLSKELYGYILLAIQSEPHTAMVNSETDSSWQSAGAPDSVSLVSHL